MYLSKGFILCKYFQTATIKLVSNGAVSIYCDDFAFPRFENSIQNSQEFLKGFDLCPNAYLSMGLTMQLKINILSQNLACTK